MTDAWGIVTSLFTYWRTPCAAGVGYPNAGCVSRYWTRPDSGGGLADGSTRASPAIGSSARWAAGAVGFVVQRADVVVADGQVAQFVAVGLV